MPKLGRRAEKEGIDFQTPGITLKNAPFGNEETGTIDYRIIGSVREPVFVRDRRNPADARIMPFQALTDKPNHMDPRDCGDEQIYKNNTQDYPEYPQQPYNEYPSYPSYGNPIPAERYFDEPTTTYAHRPDSKDIKRTLYSTRPEKDQNKIKNSMSTVFESEPWRGAVTPPLAVDTEYKTHYDPYQDQRVSQGPAPLPPPSRLHGDRSFEVSQQEYDELTNVLPSSVYLPLDPIKFTPAQEQTLAKLICTELQAIRGEEPLKGVYVDASRPDKSLSGYCDMEYLKKAIEHNNLPLSEQLIRLIAAQFVHPNERGKVNYEQIVLHIRAALQLRKKDTLQGTKKYYSGSEEEQQYASAGEVFKFRKMRKTLKMVQNDLQNYDFNYERWQKIFTEKDRGYRQTLSMSEIKSVCYAMKLPLQESVLNSLLDLCDESHGDGQYSWVKFLDLLGQVKPHNTGLPLPVSKRPLEYAKRFPQPVPSWPKPEEGFRMRNEPISTRRDKSPDRSPRGDYNYSQRQEPSPRMEQRYTDRDHSPVENSPAQAPYRGNKEGRQSQGANRGYQEDYQSPVQGPDRDYREQRRSKVPDPYRGYQGDRRSPDEGPYRDQQEDQRSPVQGPYRGYQDGRPSPVQAPYRAIKEDRLSPTQVPYRGHQEERAYHAENPYRDPRGERRPDRDDPRGRSPDRREDRRANRDPYEDGYGPHAPRESPRRDERNPYRDRYDDRYRSTNGDNSYRPSSPKWRDARNSYRDKYEDRERDANRQYPRGISPSRRLGYSRHRDTKNQRPRSYRDVPRGSPEGRGYQYDRPISYMDEDDDRYRERGRDEGPYAPRGNGNALDSRIHDLSEKVRDLEAKNAEIKAKARAKEGINSGNQLPWLDRYLKLGKALYDCDKSNTGTLPRGDVIELVDLYNKAFSLNLDPVKMNYLLYDPHCVDRSSNIKLQPFLLALREDK